MGFYANKEILCWVKQQWEFKFQIKGGFKIEWYVEEVVGHRRSQRVSNQRNVVDEHVEESSSGKSLDEVDLTDDEKSMDEVLNNQKP